ncbi:solute carrier family 13 member 5 isoform X3 [Eurytemora carolleeae]|nr:solute carrier family 13 member 5 isoform X3 [Eurytemora carolleeae]|eukprot:XP_023349618.1 solute carrier family 13 member 5-like isoform X3 [Eurytemora affinis]
MTTAQTSMYYMKSSCMLFIGGLMVAIAIENSNLHRRVGLRVLLMVGSSPRLVLLGFMIPTAILSMWISNTASTAMMIPILEAVLVELGAHHRNMMMLAIAFAANVGGTGTLIGTPPNLVFFEFIGKLKGQPITFGSWMVFCAPLMFVNLLIAWLWLQLLFLPICRKNNKVKDELENISEKGETDIKTLLTSRYKDLGSMSRHEYSVLGLFLLLVVLWLTRSPGFMTGWADLLPPGVTDATPAILISLIMFAVPAGAGGETLLNWKLVQEKLAWGVIVLLGGGFALAEGAERSCLNIWAGEQLAKLGGLPPQVLRIILSLLVSLITQVASNAATASMLLPVLLQLSQQLHLNPLYLMLPATLTTSLAFMLPVSTAPNAIVFAASGMRTVDMLKAGVGLTFITVFVTVGWTASVGIPIFSLDDFPDWAIPNNQSLASNFRKCL